MKCGGHEKWEEHDEMDDMKSGSEKVVEAKSMKWGDVKSGRHEK